MAGMGLPLAEKGDGEWKHVKGHRAVGEKRGNELIYFRGESMGTILFPFEKRADLKFGIQL